VGVGGHHHNQVALLQGKTGYPLLRRLDGAQGRSGWVRVRSQDRPAGKESFLAGKGGQWVGVITILPPRAASLEILEASNSWGSKCLSMPVIDYLYLYTAWT
jgi:hypothetical protein